MEQKLHCNMDKISNLPVNVIDEILSRMPIRDAVRTSVLSKKWNNKWASIPHLVFDRTCVLHISRRLEKASKFINIVDHVLLLHNGPIHKFELSHHVGFSDFDRWILHVSKKPIKEFILENQNMEPYKIPNCLLSCQSLIVLELFNCLMKPLSNFGGFKNLKRLVLQEITLTHDVFENLITNCPTLEHLSLIDCYLFSHLNIDAPNLKSVDINGAFDDVRFKNTFRLAEVFIMQTSDRGSSGELLNFFVNLPNVRRLTMRGYFLKYLAADNVSNRLPDSCAGLNYLSLEINFADLNEGLAALCLLRSSPYLRKLEIFSRLDDSNEGTVDSFWNTSDHWNSMFAELRLVDIRGISGTKSELDLICFLLLYSPVLESMSVKPISADGGLELLKALVGYQRTSAAAKIIYMDP